MSLRALADALSNIIPRCGLMGQLDIVLPGNWDDANAIEDYFCLMDDSLDLEWERMNEVLAQWP